MDETVLRERIRMVLHRIQQLGHDELKKQSQFYAEGPPIFRLTSSLAEGADRFAAQAALALGYELQCPIPFRREEYAKDFSSDSSRDEYFNLLHKASAVFELNGSRDSPNEAYLEAGQLVLQQSDLIVAIWDGGESGGTGGTADVIQEARRQHIPVIWIDSGAPHAMHLLDADQPADELAGTRLSRQWSPDESLELWADYLPPMMGFIRLNPEQEGERKAYVDEKETKLPIPAKIYYSFKSAVLCRNPCSGLFSEFQPYIVRAARDWKERFWGKSTVPTSDDLIRQTESKLLRYHAWSEGLADHYAQVYRSAYVANFLLAALAVACALLSLLGVSSQMNAFHGWTLLEVMIVGLILIVAVRGRRRRWHDRWMDYRILAEQLRHLRFLYPLGCKPADYVMPVHDKHSSFRDTWYSAYFRAIVREAGLVSGVVTPHYLASYRDLLIRGEIQEQIDYHENNIKSMHQLHQRLEWTCGILFVLTLGFCFAHFAHHLSHKLDFSSYDPLFAALTAFLPALSASVVGILNQGEFARLRERSEGMRDGLVRQREQFKELPADLSITKLAAISQDTAKIMMKEVMGWRILVQARPLGVA
jgi:hypothetical protein